MITTSTEAGSSDARPAKQSPSRTSQSGPVVATGDFDRRFADPDILIGKANGRRTVTTEEHRTASGHQAITSSVQTRKLCSVVGPKVVADCDIGGVAAARDEDASDAGDVVPGSNVCQAPPR